MPAVKDPKEMPSLEGLISQTIRDAAGKIGMVLTHVGVVRSSSRKGQAVSKVRVKVDEKRLEEIIASAQRNPGIFRVQAYVREGELSVGEILMILMVAGDFRENVFETLKETLEEIKKHVTSKEEF